MSQEVFDAKWVTAQLDQSPLVSLSSNSERYLNLTGYRDAVDSSPEELASVRAYIRHLFNSYRVSSSTPLFRLLATTPVEELNLGEKKWVGFIPRGEIPMRRFIRITADDLSVSEGLRLNIPEKTAELKIFIENALISIFHDAFKRALDYPLLRLDYGLGDEPVKEVSYQAVENTVGRITNDLTIPDDIPGAQRVYDAALIHFLKEMNVIPSEFPQDKEVEILREVAEAKREALDLLDVFNQAIGKIYEMDIENLPDVKPKIDLDQEFIHAPYFKLLQEAFGLNGAEEPNYQAQLLASLSNLILRLRRHPVRSLASQHHDELNQRLIIGFYHTFFVRGEVPRILAFDRKSGRWHPDVDQTQAGFTREDFVVYQSMLEGFDDLSEEQKQIYRGERGTRLKELPSILVKTLQSAMRVEHIADLEAGETVLMGIKEVDLKAQTDEGERLRVFVNTLAQKLVDAFNLTEAPKGTAYAKLPVGMFKIIPKLQPDPSNPDSFNFPSVKVYMNIPVGDGGKGVRMEHRFVCVDTWARGERERTSQSYHEEYKRSRILALFDILIPRFFNEELHTVIEEYKEWRQEKQREEKLRLAV